jgi:hypothetical protein
MSPVIFGCIICGYPIYGYTTASWLKEFRAGRLSQIYDNDLALIPPDYLSSKGTFISGVGQYNDPNGGSDELPVMWQRPENGRHGFVLHDAC